MISQLARDGSNFDGSPVPNQPFTTTWTPVSYRAAYTFEPVKNLMFYSMYATAYDPAAAGIFSVTPGTTLALTSSRIYETGVKQLLWGGKAEWTFSAYDIERQNVYVQVNDTTSTLAGEIRTKGVELAAAVRPVDDLKIWGNVAFTSAHYGNFDFDGSSGPATRRRMSRPLSSTPARPIASTIGAGRSRSAARSAMSATAICYEDDATTMLAYTTADLYAFVDVPGRDLPWQGLDTMRVTFRVRNVTNAVYAAWSDPGYPDQVYLGAPRTFEIAASAKW